MEKCLRFFISQIIAEARTKKSIGTQDDDPFKGFFDRLPLIKMRSTPDGYFGEIKISEKREKDQKSLKRAWEKFKILLKKNKWKSSGTGQTGWDSQTDTGGNSNTNKTIFVHPAGHIIVLTDSMSFDTGTRYWSVIAKVKSLATV